MKNKLLLLAFLLGTMIGGDALGAEQVITPNPASQSAAPDQVVSIDVNYTTTNPVDETLTGLGLRFHWDSSSLAFDSLSNILANGFLAQGIPKSDTSDFDNDPKTDMFLSVSWANFAGNWTGVGTTPAQLYTASFTTSNGFSESTSIKFSAISTAAGYVFDATSSLVQVAESNAITNCHSGDIILGSLTYHDENILTEQCEGSLSTRGSIILAPGARVIYQATTSVELNKGFQAHTGSEFTTIIRQIACVGEHYGWRPSAWGACTGACGAGNGTQNRTVYCEDSSGAKVSDSYCAGIKLASSQNCTACEIYDWHTSNWGQCTGACGVGNGTQTRAVYCEDSTGTMVSDSYCGSTRPASSQNCNAGDTGYISHSEYQNRFDYYVANNCFPSIVEGTTTLDGDKYRGIFEPYPSGYFYFESNHGIDENSFFQMDLTLMIMGYQLLWKQIFTDSLGDLKYQATWISGNNAAIDCINQGKFWYEQSCHTTKYNGL